MKGVIGQLLAITLIMASVFILLGLLILRSQEDHEVLIKLFGEIIVLVICSILIVYTTDRYVVSLDAWKKNKLMKILAIILPFFYKISPFFSREIAYVARIILGKL